MSLTQVYRGRSTYVGHDADAVDPVFVSVACRPGEFLHFDAMLDTAAQWCVLGAELVEELHLQPGPGETRVTLLTRYGPVSGVLRRVFVTFIGIEGTDVEVEATWFISPDWPGPTVIGWKGCLERMRFALDPTDDSFYFAEL